MGRGLPREVPLFDDFEEEVPYGSDQPAEPQKAASLEAIDEFEREEVNLGFEEETR